MANIHINIGSNENRRKNIAAAIKQLKIIFSEIKFSLIYQTPAAGFKGEDFYNLGVNAKTNLNINEVIAALRNIEKLQGRDRSLPKFSSRGIDLDLVLYDDAIDEQKNIPRKDILKYVFVLAPLVELSPNLIHPQEKKTYSQLWLNFSGDNILKSYNIDEILN